MVQVGLLCVQDNAKDRPSMSNVVFMLSNETVLPSPKKSSFPVRNSEPDSSTAGTKCFINDVTNTTFDGFPMVRDPDSVKPTLSNLAFGNVMAAAARDYQKVIFK
ncbi:hypothetical protein LWI29_032209 [Acer saccharum]|uniref:S-locus receptor kinase C-terminal domain-containing protein n=1 Tax=Acer saccharum TaxID=4024 RepID=A0AA39RTS2_ACESA|nr:hypothetical protein LWI29_032209 [Acer saccharum]